MNAPDREGWWHWDSQSSYEGIRDLEVYHGPNHELAVWCEDIGAAQFEQSITDGDEMCGHIPAWCLNGKWTFLRSFTA